MGLTLLTTKALAANTGDNTIFRAYGSAVSNALADSGWVQANDAGQINWSTVVANGTTSSYSGSEIWRMNDALANVTPCYIRWDWGTYTGTNRPQFSFTLGHSTNGSLGLQGALSANVVYGLSASTNTLYPSYFHGSNDCFSFSMWEGWTYQSLFAIERTKDANGNNTAEGFHILYGASTIVEVFWSPWTGQVQSSENLGLFSSQIAGLRTGVGSAFNWQPIFVSNGKFNAPLLNWIGGSQNHFAANVVTTVTHYGASHTYRGSPGWTTTNRSGAGSMILMMRWE